MCSVCLHSVPAPKHSPLFRAGTFIPRNNTLLLMSHKPGLNTMASKGSVSAHTSLVQPTVPRWLGTALSHGTRD